MNNLILLLGIGGAAWLFKDKIRDWLTPESALPGVPTGNPLPGAGANAGTTTGTTSTSLPNTSAILTGSPTVTPAVAPGAGMGPVVPVTPVPVSTAPPITVTEIGFPSTTAVQTNQGVVVIPGNSAPVVTTPAPAVTVPVTPTVQTQVPVPGTLAPISVTPPAPVPAPPPVAAGDTRTRVPWSELRLPPLTPRLLAEASYYGGDVLGVLERAANGQLAIGGEFLANIQTWNSLRSGNGYGTDDRVLQNATYTKAAEAWHTPLDSEEYIYLVETPEVFWGQVWPRIKSRNWA